VWAGDRPVDAGQPRQRTVLAALAVDAGRPVSPETLIDRVWGESPPPGARRSLHAHLARIRRTLAQAATDGDTAAGRAPALALRSGGYMLDVDPQRVDVHRFRALVDRARAPTCDDRRRVALLAEALGLWRAEPLTGLTGEWVRRTRDTWSQQRPEAAVAWAHAQLRLGHPEAAVDALSALAAEHPLMEPLVAALMRVLYAVGRAAEALVRYAAIRERLADELGTDPGPELMSVHRGILRGDLAPPAAATVPVPAQLPSDMAGFAGRAEQLGQLDKLLDEADSETSPAAPVFVISGTAGVGKTTLAVHWAHWVADRFPDGQLYVDLRGFDATGRVLSPQDAVRGFLGTLGVPPAGIPATFEAQTALYRSLLAGRRILVLLDNARDAEQVRPLLPGRAGTVTVITSRNPLTGLISVAAQPLTLAPLHHAEAYDLLCRRVEPDRVAAEPEATEAIIASCARLPLALAIAAARARQTGFSLAALAAELAGTGTRLDALDAGDPASRVRSVFSWSYTSLEPATAALFRLLGAHPGPDVSAAAAASLAGRPLAATRPLLAELARGSLVSEHRPGRYACHDLLRAYAAELVGSEDPGTVRQAALARLVDHYTHTAHAADRLLIPHREPMPLPLAPAAGGVTPEALADDRAAMAWLAAERQVLLAVLSLAVQAGLDRQAWQLAWSLDTFLDRRGHWHDRIAVWETVLPGTERLGEPGAAALLHARLAVGNSRLGQLDAAYAHLPRALDLYAQTGDLVGQAHTNRHYAYLAGRQDDPARALEYAKRALALFEAAGDVRGQAIVLNSVGWYSALAGDYHAAVHHCERSLALLRRLDNRDPMAATLDSLGFAHQRLGHHARAVSCYREALDLHRGLGDRFHEADVLTRLGEAHQAAGEDVAARDAWREALAVLTDLGHPDADGVRDRLRRLAAGGG
jgi:DNA-binding SARP family transcriptional activator